MTMTDTPKRRYTRLTPATWSVIRAHWELGEVTLPELADRYGVAERTLQSHFANNGTVKGAKAAEVAATIRRRCSRTSCQIRSSLRGGPRTFENVLIATRRSWKSLS